MAKILLQFGNNNNRHIDSGNECVIFGTLLIENDMIGITDQITLNGDALETFNSNILKKLENSRWGSRLHGENNCGTSVCVACLKPK